MKDSTLIESEVEKICTSAYQRFFDGTDTNCGCTLKIEAIRDALTHTAEIARQEERARMRSFVERVKLDVDVIICDCGKRYSDSDLGITTKELVDALSPTHSPKES